MNLTLPHARLACDSLSPVRARRGPGPWRMALFAAVALMACDGGGASAPGPSLNQVGPAGQPAAPAPAAAPEAPRPAGEVPMKSSELTILDADKEPLWEITVGADAITIAPAGGGAGQPLIGTEVGGKREWRWGQSGSLVAVVKTQDGGFKLKDAAGALLWKVKLSADKIKISDNDENAHPFELKGQGEKIKVLRDGAEIGAVKFYADKGRIKVKEPDDTVRFQLRTDRQLPWAGVLLMGDIPEALRYVLMGELAARLR